MSDGVLRFDRFVLDPVNRRLSKDGETVELSGRYLDALILMVREQGGLVSKARFMDEVWRGVPVTDEALTQCVRSLRRALGDDASRPRFIETAPRHGYRFVAPVVSTLSAGPAATAEPRPGHAGGARWGEAMRLAVAGAVGGGAAGALGGLAYGALGVVDPLQPGMGATSALLVILSVAVLLGLAAGASVALGIGAGRAFGRTGPWSLVGGAAGGLVIGSVVKLIGSDAFMLMFGQSPGDVTGGPEGAVLGAAVGAGVWLAGLMRPTRPGRRAVALGAVAGAAGGLLIAATGGRLLGGSLAQVAERFSASRLRLDGLGGLFGETGFGPMTQAAAAGMEGALFTAGVVAAIVLAERHRRGDAPHPAMLGLDP